MIPSVTIARFHSRRLPQSKFNVFKIISRYSLIRRPGSLTTSCSLKLMPAKYSLTSVSHPLLTCTSDSFQAFDHCSNLLGPLRQNLFSCLTCQNHHLNPTVPPGFAIPALSPVMVNTLLSNCSLGETSLATVEQRECHLPLRAHYELILSPASKVPCTLKQHQGQYLQQEFPKQVLWLWGTPQSVRRKSYYVLVLGPFQRGRWWMWRGLVAPRMRFRHRERLVAGDETGDQPYSFTARGQS